MSLLPPSPPFTRSAIEAAQLRKPIATMQKRTRACTALGLSFRDRTIFLSFYVLSLPVYHHSTLLPSSPFYRIYFTLIRRLLAPRHWIQASQLPGIVTYLRLGILHCRHIHLTCSLLGYCLRCYGEPIALWLCYVTSDLPSMPTQLRDGLHTVRRLLLSANCHNPEPFIYPLQRYLHNNHSPYKLSRLVLSQVKLHLRQQLLHNALNFLRERLSQVDWAFSSSSFTLEALHATPLKAIPSFSRLAILRWIIDSEPDVHFRLRPHFTRSSPCRCGCGKFSSLFPYGFHSGSVHHSHFSFSLTWTLLARPSLISAFPHFFKQRHPPLPSFTSSPVWYTRKGLEVSSLDILPPPLTCWLSQPCVLCGGGDNAVQHCLNFCPIPALAGSLLLNRPWRTRYWHFARSHSLGHRSLIASLWVATRQFVHERSGLPPPSLVPPPVASANTLAFPRLLAERAYRPVPATSTSLSSDDLIGIFPPSAPLIKKIFAFQRSVARPPNCTLQFKLCPCGAIHGYLQALLPLPPNSPLFIGDPDVEQHDLVIHFDGGCFKELQIGGAGVVIWNHTAGLRPYLSLSRRGLCGSLRRGACCHPCC